MVKPGVRREAIAQLMREHEVSERRACSALQVDRSSVRYHARRPGDTQLRTRLKALSSERKRFGYRRLHVMLAREGWHVNHKKLRRIYREEDLQTRIDLFVIGDQIALTEWRSIWLTKGLIKIEEGRCIFWLFRIQFEYRRAPFNCAGIAFKFFLKFHEVCMRALFKGVMLRVDFCWRPHIRVPFYTIYNRFNNIV